MAADCCVRIFLPRSDFVRVITLVGLLLVLVWQCTEVVLLIFAGLLTAFRSGVDIATCVSEPDEAFRVDLVSVSTISYRCQRHSLPGPATIPPLSTHSISATSYAIADACDNRIEGFDRSSIGKILDFLTLHPVNVLML